MAQLPKRQLLAVVEDAIRESGWSFLRLTAGATHPARYHVFRDGTGYRVRVHIWNVTPGGRSSLPHEYRIQMTGIEEIAGVRQIQPEIGGKTLILGWWDGVDVFAGFDYTHHDGPIGGSNSIQIGEAALHAAHTNNFATHNRGSGELAIAFRPEFLGSYIENLESLHECGQSAQETQILDEIGSDPASVDDAQIAGDVAQERQYAVVSTKRALRDISFRDRILTAYGHRCAMCGVQLKLLDAAHVLPVVHPDSTDETSNGVALCALHHRAYDRAFVTFDEKFRVHHNAKMAAALKVSGHDGGLADFTKTLRPILILPPALKDRPTASFVKQANTLRGW